MRIGILKESQNRVALAPAEAKKLGFETVILPEVNRAATESMKGIRLIYVAGIRDAISYIMR